MDHNPYVLHRAPKLNRLRPDHDNIDPVDPWVWYRVGKSPREKLRDPVDLSGSKYSWDQTFDPINDKMRPWNI